jgi:hypothetical protein
MLNEFLTALIAGSFAVGGACLCGASEPYQGP